MPSTTHKTKPLKWAQQSQPYNKKARAPRCTKKVTVASSTSCKSNPDRPVSELDRLEKDLAFTHDTLATIIVHLESLHLAYTSSIPDLQKDFCPREKELLSAYDDLGLQVTHLERKIKKLEARIQEIHNMSSPVLSAPVDDLSAFYRDMVSPSSSVYDSPDTFYLTSPTFVDTQSPCMPMFDCYDASYLQTSAFGCQEITNAFMDPSLLVQ
ncbi:hypothetical protein DM01DRAFT_1339367 [Hesseltinella vesiculosa]|uniref:Uncharacterized protein n=1 Tax=Hesseltinella vesiculosa TaxID=101127 RepID=A0A1X2G7N0_9FUNG|nr:hypothetical protein DM01DRAFT_1339367 [Hesseltinella vesiculosa]